LIAALASQSTHPHSLAIVASLKLRGPVVAVSDYREIPGCGIEGTVHGHRVQLGSATWVDTTTSKNALETETGSLTHLAVDGHYRGAFLFNNTVPAATQAMLQDLSGTYELALLSGDNAREGGNFRQLLGPKAILH